ncbi:hypothetical protein [Candidatus Villigracilis saccharophilus]|uniref:hypothetical protein n=1 Tax=Candidatus Villigracilis saccharophilus TaxID=3140684 RepID=UPI0031350D0D|nr:hypothetical protein [Anaerolineales bacterium]
MKNYFMIILLGLLPFFARPNFVQAQSAPTCTFQPDGSIICTIGGNDDGGDEPGDGNEEGGGACVPGQHMVYQVTAYDPAAGICSAFPAWVDNCTGQIVESGGDMVDDLPCDPQAPAPQNPCDRFTAGAGGITCTNSEWNISARVSFPEIYLDLRPYPATLVRWPTAIRNGGMLESSGSGGKNYLSYGGGSPAAPHVGDWQNLRLTLTLRAAGPMFVTLPYIGDLMLPDQGAGGSPRIIQWEVPSHPAVGAGTQAGSISGLEELPADMPVFTGRGRAPYKLFWELRYFEYTAIEDCVPGPNRNGRYNCDRGTGHMEVVDHEWRRDGDNGEVAPSAVRNLPAAVKADINNDGIPDAYWDNNLTIRRMDNNNSVNSPLYGRSWNWGGVIYWAVREGQGQIGWPGD